MICPRFLSFFLIALSLVSLDLASSASLTADEPALDWVGIQGHYRADHWTAVRLDAALKGQNIQTPSALTIETTDGDGVSVLYEQNFLGSNSKFGYCRPGTEASPLVVKKTTSNGENTEILQSTRFPEVGEPSQGPTMIPLGMPWIVVLGDPLGIETIGVNDLLDRGASVAVTRIQDADNLPDHSLGFSGVDLLMVTSTSIDLLDQLQAEQASAIKNWVQSGGQLLVTLGADTNELLTAASWLKELLPNEVTSSDVVRLDPAGFETFTSSQSRLRPFEGWRLPKAAGTNAVGKMLINGRTTRKVGVPLAARYVTGLGRTTIIAADLETTPFAKWPQRLELVTKVAGDVLDTERPDVSSSIRLSGYSDLSGQVRRSLDQFPIKRSISFAIVALIITVLIALVGPLDFLFLRKMRERSWLGWLTFPLLAIALSVGLVFAAAPRPDLPGMNLKPSQKSAMDEDLKSGLRANTIEILDLEMTTQTGRLFSWSYLYSHNATNADVSVQVSDSVQPLVKSAHTKMVGPLGAPGLALGGIQIEDAGSTMRSPISSIQSSDSVSAKTLQSHITSLQIPPRSSKSISLQLEFDCELEAKTMKRRRGSELLSGSLQNPLNVDLLDSMLIYKNWVYLLPTRFPAAAILDDVNSLRQKNFRWQLSRQRALESSSQSEAWDITGTDQPNRLAEMFLFHDAVGGARYTNLRHEVLGRYDLSHLLVEDRCILMGRCRESWANLSVNRNDETATTVPQGKTSTWVRVILPVEETRR